MLKDKIILGGISGVTATIAKSLIIEAFKHYGLAEFNGVETAAGMLLPAYKVATPGGKVVGHIANIMVGTALGVGTTYMLTATGKDKAFIKAAGTSALFWTFFYGNYAMMGGSTVRPALPGTILSNFVGHLGYGAVCSYMITRLGDPSLFADKQQDSPIERKLRPRPNRLRNPVQRVSESSREHIFH